MHVVVLQMNRGGRVVLCGQIAVYNTSLPYPPPLPEKTAEIIAERRIKRFAAYLLCFLACRVLFHGITTTTREKGAVWR